ncbi:MAG: tetratricopeptide repeat protein [bacterium]|nr:tetratricopeptide repeat protein [bacterium]
MSRVPALLLALTIACAPTPSQEDAAQAKRDNANGLEHFQRGRFEPALKKFDAAIDADPTVAEYSNNAGIARLRLGDPNKAYYDFRRAERLQPKTALYTHNKGLALRQAGRPDEARDAFEQAIAIDESFFDSYDALANLYFDAKRYDAARETWERAANIAETPPVLTNLARVNLTQRRDFGAVQAYIKDALRIDPGYAPAYYVRGMLNELEANWPAAEKDFRAARKIDPEFLEAYFKHAIALVQLEQSEQAIATLEAFIQRAPPKEYMQQIVAARVQINKLKAAQ